MTKILVTGATGRLGNAVLRSLVQKIPASNVVAMARDTEKAEPLAALGIEVRYGDYTDYDSLVAAFEGVEKIYLVSAVAFSDRVAHHTNVIVAAGRAGVRHVVYTSIQRINDELAPIEGVTESDIATERLLEKSGLTYTIIQHPLYADDLPFFIGANAANEGFSVPAGQGRIGPVTYAELAEAGAALLTQTGYENRTCLLNAGQTWSFQDVADGFSRLTGMPVEYQPISAEAFIAARESEGWPTAVAKFISGWGNAIDNGAFDQSSRTLEKLLGRKPKHLEGMLKEVFKL
ncbi:MULTISPECIES: NmrA family NAD(P)-binding protein [Pseudomonas]|jgi:NAD(P)H dehydrogenase (quinone)|uniref:NmrA family NAD(P)-binding protein n=2 Tax=Pseudomonas TaxID=286 RepID=A0AB36CZ39_9PSED|nr:MULTISPECIES: NmrA family NAD(P)-binding protein [Pseudomonas]NMZ81322.1 NmrA family NAD(P)-binding protein [Pseudomonas mandelii]PMV89446.1 oxidoreductase [Pseudomonas sp. GW101-1A09]PMV99409.1 oxidoreductase [Pseudomonas sp. FW306-2-2C-B10A]PMW00763.1 oxidoreductase [Pseudomonas sp. GW460-C8]PMW03201.1 oxidoreductase [Pseudomonas sp. MPR-TSA4]